MQLGAEVALPVRECNMACGTYAFRGVMFYLVLSLRCACASKEPRVIVSLCLCATLNIPLRPGCNLRRPSPCISHFLNQCAVPVCRMGQQDSNPLCPWVGCVLEFVGFNF